MAQRLMTPFCFASLLAAALIAEGAIAMPAAKAAPAATTKAETVPHVPVRQQRPQDGAVRPWA
jgi:hypothetical protein